MSERENKESILSWEWYKLGSWNDRASENRWT